LAEARLLFEQTRCEKAGFDLLLRAFNDLRRSTAWRQLALIQSHGLLTEEEMADFTAETHGVIELLAGFQ
jgi:hypothetical protein